MRIGVFGDAHDHVDNVRHAVNTFNRAGCKLVVFAGDFCSPIVVPPLRKLHCPMLACFGDNDGNVIGIQGGMRIIGQVALGPFGFTTDDGTRLLVAHQLEALREWVADADIIISAHTHRPVVAGNEKGRLFVNPGETSGWTSRRPTVAIIETDDRSAEIVPLPEMPPAPVVDE